MTDDQKILIKHLEGVSIYYPGKAKRFIKSMSDKLKDRPDSEVSPGQLNFMFDLIHTYRRQIPFDIHRKYCTNKLCQLKMAEQEALKRQLSFQF